MSKIIPEKEEYKISISVEENDILKITIGNDVNYHFNYPDESRKEIIKGKIELISRDSVVRENGKKYYTVIGNIEAKNIKNLKLKKGMTLESNIIYSKKRIIDYILEVAGFKLKRLL